MKKLSAFLLRGYLFWLLFFFINRLVFAVYNYEMMDENGITGVLPAFWYGLRLDLSLTAYLMMPIVFFYLISLFTGAEFIRKVSTFYFIICFCLVSIIATADLQLYREWGTKINAQVFNYITHPQEVLATSGSAPVGILLLLLALQITVGILLFRYMVAPVLKRDHYFTNSEKLLQVTFSMVVSALSVLMMRGGLQLSPMNQSFVYYSNSAGANQCAVNASWNLFYYLANSGNNVDPAKYVVLDEHKADSVFNELYVEDDSIPALFNTKPNIVLVILESFTADGMKQLGGEDLMPELGKLSQEGLLFENIYASGDRTDKGLAAILSAFPSQPVSSIVTEPSRYSALKSLPAELKSLKYHSSFVYGGDAEFANMKAYLMHAGFDEIIDREAFAASEMNSKWGAHDEAIFDRSIASCKNQSTPFFHCVLTLSSHEPFDAPGFRKISGDGEAEKFRNSILYTDSCIGDYIRKASRQPWFSNTVFIFVADHGHRLIGAYDNNFNPRKFRIPLVIYGPALNASLKGKRLKNTGSQTDIAATLTVSLGMKNSFRFSRNLMSERQAFAFYAYNDGLGWVRGDEFVCYDYVSRTANYFSRQLKPAKQEELLLQGQSYMQKMMEEYSAFNPLKR